MEQELNIGVIGDFDQNKTSHPPTNDSLKHAADHWPEAERTWLPTPSLVPLERGGLDRFDGLWASPGSPYRSMEGASWPSSRHASSTSRSWAPEGASSMLC